MFETEKLNLHANEAALLASIERGLSQAAALEFAAVHTPEAIERRRGGRPRQAVTKSPVTLRMDPEVLARWRASGRGWQTRMAEVLARAI